MYIFQIHIQILSEKVMMMSLWR